MNTLSFNHPRVYFVSSHSTGHALIWDNGKCQQKTYSDVIWDGTTFLVMTRFWKKPQHDRNSRDMLVVLEAFIEETFWHFD